MQETNTEASGQLPPPKLATRRKVKTGCLTCKIRKVKCDQQKPACHRCVSTGRTCDGYGIWGGGSQAAPCNPALSVRIQGVPSDLRLANDVDKTCFEWFIHRSIIKLPGAFGSQVWSSLVCQATYNDPAVLNAVLAFSCAHEVESARLCRVEDVVRRPREGFMLSHYGKAIRLLQPHLETGDRTSICVALVTCLVFTCLEVMRDRHQIGLLHLQSGLKLINSNCYKLGAQSRGWTSIGHDGLIETFARMDLEAVMFGQYDRPLLIQQPFRSEAPPVVFDSVRQARRSLERLVRHLLHLASECRVACSKRENDRSNDAVAASQQRRIQLDLDWWHVSFEASRVRLLAERGSLGLIAYRMLRAYYTMATIMAATCTNPDDEMSYDACTPQFELIMSQSSDSAEAAMANKLHQETSTIYPYVADAAHLPALYYTAVKCRDSDIRRRAVKVLRRVDYKEGLWDSMLAAQVAEAVIDLEEGGQLLTSNLSSQSQHGNGAALPGMCRVSIVRLLLPDEPGADGMLVCKRKRLGGDPLIVRHTISSWRTAHD